MKNSPNELLVGCGRGISSSNMVGHFLYLEETIDDEWHRAWHEGPYFFERLQGTSGYNRHGRFLGTSVIWVNQGEARMRSPLDACLFLWSRMCPFVILIFFVLVIMWLIMSTQDIVSHLVRNLSFISTICLEKMSRAGFPPSLLLWIYLCHLDTNIYYYYYSAITQLRGRAETTLKGIPRGMGQNRLNFSMSIDWNESINMIWLSLCGQTIKAIFYFRLSSPSHLPGTFLA